MAKGTAVAKKKATEISTNVENIDFLADAGKGQEKFDASNMATPFLKLLQYSSPEIKEEEPKYIDGAKPGMFFDTVTKELYNTKEIPLRIVPCEFNESDIEWPSRDAKSSAPVATHRKDNTIPFTVDEKNNRVMENKNVLVLTRTYYILIINDKTGEIKKAILSLASTGLKPAGELNNMINSQVRKNDKGVEFDCCIWFKSYSLTSKPAVNPAGESYFVVNFEPAEDLMDSVTKENILENGYKIYTEARRFNLSVSDGEIELVREAQKAEATETAEEGPTVEGTAEEIDPDNF